MKNKENLISFWRVIFTYTIMLLHLFNQYSHGTGWRIGVEFFFVVGGWLLAADLDKKNREPYEYTWHRIKRIYPEYISAFIVATICLFIFKKYDFTAAVKWIGQIGWKEALIIHYWPWDDGTFANGFDWYISVMLLAGLLLYSLLKRIPKLTYEVIIPVIGICFLTYSYRTVGGLTGGDCVEGFLYHCRFLRGFTEMGIGILLYGLNKKYAVFFQNNLVRIMGFVLLIFEVAASYHFSGWADYLYLLIIAIGVIISFNTPLFFGKKIIAYFDKLSFSMYLNHLIFRTYFMPYFFDALSIKMVIIYVISVTIFAVFMHYLTLILATQVAKIIKYIFKRQIVEFERCDKPEGV